MFSQLRHLIFTALFLLLFGSFLFEMGDPAILEKSAEGALPIYSGWRSIIDFCYMVSGTLNVPVAFLYNVASAVFPSLQSNSWFPYMEAAIVGNSIKSFVTTNTSVDWPPTLVQTLNGINFDALLPGIVDWFIVLTFMLLNAVNTLIDPIVDTVKNLVWNILIEFSFTKKKQTLYQEALEKRAADLMKLTVEYRNLSKETSKLKDSVITDELTKVYNKRFFIDKIRDEFNNAKENKTILGIIMMDIDHFKKLNDTYGHLMGDKVLQRVAEVAKNATPKGCFCCRFGGEEFSVIMPAASFDMAIAIAEEIKRNVPQLRFEEDPSLKVTISQGMCYMDFKSPVAATMNQFDDFVKLADDELYRAKLGGRDRINFNKIE